MWASLESPNDSTGLREGDMFRMGKLTFRVKKQAKTQRAAYQKLFKGKRISFIQ